MALRGSVVLLSALLGLQGILAGTFDWRSSRLNLGQEQKKQSQLTEALDQDIYYKYVKFYILNRQNPKGARVDPDDGESFLKHGFDKKLPTMVIIHGFGHTIEGGIFTTVAGALLEAGEKVNVVGVDWGELCPKPHYLTSRKHVAGAGRRVAEALRTLRDRGLVRLHDLHVVGHSLGAHVAGNAGKHLHGLARITGLDPALPLFHIFSPDRLAPSDADLVDVIHTCGGVMGYLLPLGTVDFYPNGGGVRQPGCRVGDGVTLLEAPHCSHRRAYELFAESVLNKHAFTATRCDSFYGAIDGSCSNATAVAVGRMGINVQYSSPGVYFLRTRSSSPFSIESDVEPVASTGRA